MLITTTPQIEGKKIISYQGVVFGEVVLGINFMKDLAASFSNFFGGRSATYENELIEARANALNEMMQRAERLGSNGIVGVSVDYEVLGADNGMMMVIASGTAIKYE